MVTPVAMHDQPSAHDHLLACHGRKHCDYLDTRAIAVMYIPSDWSFVIIVNTSVHVQVFNIIYTLQLQKLYYTIAI